MAVTVPGVLGQDAAEVLLAEDQHVVRALADFRLRGPLVSPGSCGTARLVPAPGPSAVPLY